MDQPGQDPSVEEELGEDPQETEEQSEPELVKIRLDGKTLTVTADVADAIHAREQASQKRFSEQGAELGRLRAQHQPPTKPATPDRTEQNMKWYADPEGIWEERETRLRQEFDSTLAQREHLADQRRTYWNTFYSNNQEFVGREKLVNAVVASEYQRLSQLSPEDAHEALADHLHELLGTEPEDKPKKTPMSNRKVIAERSANPPVKGRQTPASTKPVTLSSAISARAEARRKSLYNIKSE